MSTLLMPLFLIGKSIRFGNNNPWMALFFIPVLLVLAYKVKKEPDKIFISISEFRAYIVVLGVLFLSQLTATVIDYFRSELGLGSIVHIISHFTVFIAGISVFWLIIKVFVKSPTDVKNFVKGANYTLVAVLVLCLAQLIFIKVGLLKGPLNFIAMLFEERPGAGNASWYTAGSYVTTNFRINGLTQEPGYLSAQIAIIFVPFLLASIKTKISGFTGEYSLKNQYFIWIALISFYIILFLSGSTTSIIAILIITIILISFYAKTPLSWAVFIIALLLVLGLAFIMFPSFAKIINKVVIAKFSFSNLSFAQRAGSTVSLFRTWMHNLLWGVGYDNTASYGYQFAPDFMKHNTEYLYTWPVIQGGIFPVLSIIMGLLAQFGIIPILTIGMMVYTNYKRLKAVARKNQSNGFSKYVFYVFKYVLIIYFFMSFFSFDWLHPEYLILFFFLNQAYRALSVDNLFELSDSENLLKKGVY